MAYLFVAIGVLVVVDVIVTVLVLRSAGARRWSSQSEALHQELEAGPRTPPPPSPEVMETLPPVVQRYLHVAGARPEKRIRGVEMEQEGLFNMSPTGEKWVPFTATQRVSCYPPGFDWDARMRLARVAICVRDAYVGGHGILQAALFGLFPILSAPEGEDLDRGELMRFLAEAPLYPTALLPGAGLSWEEADDRSAWVTLKDGSVSVRLLFRFGADGLVREIEAEDRPRIVGRTIVPQRWLGRWTNYVRHDGFFLPLEGEVAWVLPEGEQPYWRGRITSLKIEYSQPG